MIIERQLNEWSKQTPSQKKKRLYETQKATLEAFRERHAISQQQYEISLHDMTVKMGYAEDRV